MTDKDRMLDELTTAMRRLHARRRLGSRLATTSAMLAIAAVAVWMTVSRRSATLEDFGPGLPHGRGAPTVQIVRHAPRTGLIRTIDDEELLVRLAEINRPTGMIRTEGRVRLTQAVVGPAGNVNGGSSSL